MDASYADEKMVTQHVEEIAHLESQIDPKAEARVVRKIDICVIPIVTLLFLLNFIDRSAVGNANVAGLSKDLKLKAKTYEYNIGLMIFYVFYILVEPGSNLILKKVGARWVSILTIGFGAVTIGSAFMRNFGEFIVVRILLGCFEGGTIPGIAFILSRFYRRHELVFRIGIFLALGPSLSGAFGGLLAGALLKGGPIGTVGTWRKIFLVEGIITTGVGFLSIFIMADGPSTAWFLSAEEKELAVRRLASEHIGEQNSAKSSPKAIKQGFSNLQTYLCCFAYGLINIPVQGASLFLPTVIRAQYEGKISTVQVQLRSVPPYAVACVWTLFVAWRASRSRSHGRWIAGSLIMTIIGYIILVTVKNPSVLYAALFFTYSGAVPCGPIFVAWATSNAAPDTSRAITTALVPGLGTYGSIIATWAYLPQFAPRYLPGNALNIGSASLAAATALGIRWYCQRENRLRDQGKRDHRLDGLTPEEVTALGSRHPEFRYLL